MRLAATFLGLTFLLAAARPAVAAPTWEPAKTYALMVGVVEWQDKELTKFPKENRQDRALEKALKARGVPADHIVFLEDRQATLAAIRSSLDRITAQAGPDSTLVFYFTGHGLRDDGQMYLANYDIHSEHPKGNGLSVSELGNRLAGNFKGSRVLLMADCCHSGAVSAVVKKLGAKGKATACLTSATASNESTGNWTFTESVISALQGNVLVDRNHDRRVSFDEVDSYIHDEMKYGEDQLTHGVRAGGFEADWQWATVPAHQTAPASGGTWKVGMWVDGHSENDWYRAKILKVEPSRAYVHFVGYESEQDEWLKLSDLRPLANTRYKPGQRVQIQYEDKWYLGKIVKSAENYFNFVTYDEYDESENEWVTDTRLKPASGR